MRNLIGLPCLLATFFSFQGCVEKGQVFNQPVEENIQLKSTVLGVSVIADSLFVPWELVWGPDDWLWVTEQPGIVSRINPETGEKRVLLRLPIGDRPEGLQAMVVHPDQDNYPYVYLNYKRFDNEGVRHNVVERYTYQADTLVEPKLIMEDRAGRSHAGARLAFHGAERLLWATGDQYLKEALQDMDNINGKVLRMDLDGNIPDDNPFPNSYVYALGFRNMQGMVVTPSGDIYTSEHGDATEDEINLIIPRGNYGFPNIEGMVDNDLEYEFSQTHNTIEPVIAWTPTIAPAGLTYYASKTIPEWEHALLLVMLKGQGLRVLNLNSEGDKIVKEEVFLEKIYGRIRAICVSPAGDVYISTSNHDWNPMTQPMETDDRILRIAKVDTAVKTPLTAKTAEVLLEEATTGEALYQQYCFSCHTSKGTGIEGIYPSLVGSDVVKDNQEFVHILMNGSSGDYIMPAFDFISDDELHRIINYVRSTFTNQVDSIDVDEVVRFKN